MARPGSENDNTSRPRDERFEIDQAGVSVMPDQTEALDRRRSRAVIVSSTSCNPRVLGSNSSSTATGLADDALRHGVPDQLFEHLAVRLDAVGQRIAGDLHHPPVHLVDLGRLLDLPGLEALEIDPLRARERVEHIGGEVRMRGEQLVLDHDGVVDRIVAALAQRREPGLQRVGDQRLHVRAISTSTPMAAASSPDDQHVLHLLAGLDRHHVGGRLVFGDVLVARQHPGDLAEIDAVLVLQHAARPDAGGDRVAAVDADPLALEVLGTADAGLGC